MLIGIDFDNTIAGYDRLFMTVAGERGLIPADAAGWTKKQVRDHLRASIPDGEIEWQRLQGQVYGKRMGGAELIPGVGAFLRRCRQAGIPVVVVSHKTLYGHFDPDRVNLRDAARTWMAAQGFFDPNGFGLTPEQAYFEGTREEKVARIAALGCTHFVDDLEEVFREPDFPDGTRRCLFAAGQDPLPSGPFRAFATWEAISDDILGPAA